jgi:Cu(I)/Ag(I) efflux system membrane protein CusA/SilA
MRVLRAVYRPVLAFALGHRAITLFSAAALFSFAVYLATTIGSEFMPPLDEETAMWMPITDPSISLTKAMELMVEQDRIIAADPEVKMVVGKIARRNLNRSGADQHERTSSRSCPEKPGHGTTKDSILQRLDNKLHTPGVANIWTADPESNHMLSTGIRTQVGVKVFGKDESIESKSAEIERVLHDVPGAVDLYAEKITGAPYVEIRIDRDAAARRGVSVGDIQDVIETAIGGKNLTYTIEGREHPVRSDSGPGTSTRANSIGAGSVVHPPPWGTSPISSPLDPQ